MMIFKIIFNAKFVSCFFLEVGFYWFGNFNIGKVVLRSFLKGFFKVKTMKFTMFDTGIKNLAMKRCSLLEQDKILSKVIHVSFTLR